MHQLKLFIAAAAILFLTSAPLHAFLPCESAMNYSFKTVLDNSTVDADARGYVSGRLVQGRYSWQNYQRLQIKLAKLNPDTQYQLAAIFDDDPDAALIPVTGFTTTARGSYRFFLVNRGGVTQPFPNSLDPVTSIRSLLILDGSGRIVLRTDMTNPHHMYYWDRDCMKNTGFLLPAAGTLVITATAKTNRFALKASGLAPSRDYLFMIDDDVMQTYTSDTRGNLRFVFRKPAEESINVFDYHTLALTDDTSARHIILIAELGQKKLPDSIAPTVTLTVPDNASTGVAFNTKVSATFSELFRSLDDYPCKLYRQTGCYACSRHNGLYRRDGNVYTNQCA